MSIIKCVTINIFDANVGIIDLIDVKLEDKFQLLPFLNISYRLHDIFFIQKKSCIFVRFLCTLTMHILYKSIQIYTKDDDKNK